MPTIFYEEQRFGAWLSIMMLATIVFVLVMVALTAKSGSEIMTAGGIIVLAELLPLGLILSAKMITELRDDGIYVQGYPITRLRRSVGYDEVKSCVARDYSPIGEYGGWGIRFGAHGKAYNMRGNRGVQLELESGERLLIGSQKADELAEAIQTRIANRR